MVEDDFIALSFFSILFHPELIGLAALAAEVDFSCCCCCCFGALQLSEVFAGVGGGGIEAGEEEEAEALEGLLLVDE